ncbi:MFS transporter [Synechococcus sp. A10-1-5-1]|uniref:MFS transporter n=1 Tax=Synechococcus sp. A10-1-5-1 TaxID=2936507 RepID=UPI002000F851|nr:MFS transporter [Synechococcus sp. A10-1-5-1]UPM51042.1 MFS transporter [Synechococcus sp. A10-1-5-1]
MQATGWSWWHQFPPALRELASVRLVASFGAGGILYLTPMVFHQQDFSASSIGLGLALAALAGTVGRFISGALLDQGRSCGTPVLMAAACGFVGDGFLLQASTMAGYVAGQLCIGMAGGLYWPAVELAVPQCASPLPSAQGYALVRSADALGVASGTLTGSLLAAAGRLRGVYWIDIAAVLGLAALLLLKPLPRAGRAGESAEGQLPLRQWLPALLPMLGISVIATSIPALMQSALPLDLVRGGLNRAGQPESWSALLIGLKLGLLVLIQWPVGRALALRPVGVGLGLSLVCFSTGTLILAASALSSHGILLVVVALAVVALGEAAFLPTATEAVVELSPQGHGGLAMALFSQCFALSAFAAPLLAGVLLDEHGHGMSLWMATALACGLSLLLIGPIQRRSKRRSA